MSTLTVTSKGQVTLRKDLLDHLGIRPGEKIVIEKLPDGRIEVKASRPAGKISDVFGVLKDKRKGRTLSIEEINELAAGAWAGKR
jgi:AbrB family looped-hinge helix DNA binding protein